MVHHSGKQCRPDQMLHTVGSDQRLFCLYYIHVMMYVMFFAHLSDPTAA